MITCNSCTHFKRRDVIVSRQFIEPISYSGPIPPSSKVVNHNGVLMCCHEVCFVHKSIRTIEDGMKNLTIRVQGQGQLNAHNTCGFYNQTMWSKLKQYVYKTIKK